MILTYFEYDLDTKGLRSLFLIKENSFSTAAILKEYGAKNITGRPNASKFTIVSLARWMEALSISMIAVFRQSGSLLSKCSMRSSMNREKVNELFLPWLIEKNF